VALALVIARPIVHTVFLVLDIWGCYLVIGLRISCLVRPCVVAADGTQRPRHGVLPDIRIPAELVARARGERREGRRPVG
jgi:hypothetical protein